MAVSVVVVLALVQAVRRAGLDVDDFFSGTGFDRRRLDDPRARIPLAEYGALIEHALEFTADPALGLRIGASSGVQERSVAAQVVIGAETLRDGLKAATEFHRLHTDELPFVVEEEERTVIVRMTGIAGPPACRRFGSEVALSGFYRLVQHFVPGARPEMAAFEYSAPSHRTEYARVFHGTERFDQPLTGLVLDRKLMDARQPSPDEDLRAALLDIAGRRLARLGSGVSFGEKVVEYVASAAGRPRDLVSVARALGLTPHALRAHLVDEGVTFHEAVEKALVSTAIELLVTKRRTIQEAAYEMSFSQASAFCRAFKRWTGSTPRQYQLLKGTRAVS